MLQNLYPHLLGFHGLLRWVALAAAIAAILVALSGWSGTKPAGRNLRLASVIYVITMDIQLLLGLLLVFRALFQAATNPTYSQNATTALRPRSENAPRCPVFPIIMPAAIVARTPER